MSLSPHEYTMKPIALAATLLLLAGAIRAGDVLADTLSP